MDVTVFDMTPSFASGIDLSRQFYRDQIAPQLETSFPGLPHSAALIGRGSEVLGFDDAMSRDHNCEARAVNFVTEDDHERYGEEITTVLQEKLPKSFSGQQTTFELTTLRGYVSKHLEVDLDHEMTPVDWLTISEQRLLMFTAGAVFHDDLGLEAQRARFAYYPQDVWLYLMATGWWRVHPEANLTGRAGFIGDEIGSTLIGARLVQDLMRLCFLLERRYAPYAKWFGTAFTQLPCATDLTPAIRRTLQATSWQDREDGLLACYEHVAALHNRQGVTPPVETEIVQLWDRPFKVLWGDFPTALHAAITDPDVKDLSDRWPIAGVDHFREVLWPPNFRQQLLKLFAPETPQDEP